MTDPNPIEALLAAVDDVGHFNRVLVGRTALCEAAFAVRAQLAQPMSDDDLAQVYLDARAIEDARSLQSGVVAPHAAGLRAVERAVRERLGVK